MNKMRNRDTAKRTSRERTTKYINHHYSTRYETKNEISEASRNLKQGVTTYKGSANAMGIP